MEIETEATIKGKVICPYCGKEFETELTGEVCVEVEPDDYAGDLD